LVLCLTVATVVAVFCFRRSSDGGHSCCAGKPRRCPAGFHWRQDVAGTKEAQSIQAKEQSTPPDYVGQLLSGRNTAIPETGLRICEHAQIQTEMDKPFGVLVDLSRLELFPLRNPAIAPR
jgi:hypothetical protein